MIKIHGVFARQANTDILLVEPQGFNFGIPACAVIAEYLSAVGAVVFGNFMQCTPKLLRATMAVFDGGCPLPGVWANQSFDIASAVFAYPDHIIETHRRDLCFEPAALIAENFTTVSAMMFSQQEGKLLLAASAEVSKIVLDPRRLQNEICWW